MSYLIGLGGDAECAAGVTPSTRMTKEQMNCFVKRIALFGNVYQGLKNMMVQVHPADRAAVIKGLRAASKDYGPQKANIDKLEQDFPPGQAFTGPVGVSRPTRGDPQSSWASATAAAPRGQAAGGGGPASDPSNPWAGAVAPTMPTRGGGGGGAAAAPPLYDGSAPGPAPDAGAMQQYAPGQPLPGLVMRGEVAQASMFGSVSPTMLIIGGAAAIGIYLLTRKKGA